MRADINLGMDLKDPVCSENSLLPPFWRHQSVVILLSHLLLPYSPCTFSHSQNFQMSKSVPLLLRLFTWTRDKSLRVAEVLVHPATDAR